MTDVPRMVSVAQAAELSGLPQSRIRLLINNGSVRFIRCGRCYKVNAQSLADYLNEGDEPQQPTLAQYENHHLKKEFTNDEAKN